MKTLDKKYVVTDLFYGFYGRKTCRWMKISVPVFIFLWQKVLYLPQ